MTIYYIPCVSMHTVAGLVNMCTPMCPIDKSFRLSLGRLRSLGATPKTSPRSSMDGASSPGALRRVPTESF